MNRKEQLISDLEMVFNGQPWYGPSLMEKLGIVNFQWANKKYDSVQKSIATIVQHLISWRKFTIEKLKGNADFNIQLNTIADWKPLQIRDAAEWKALLKELYMTQNTLVTLLKKEVRLEEKVPGKDYDYQFLIRGTIQHDIYHLGQIGLIYSFLNANNTTD